MCKNTQDSKFTYIKTEGGCGFFVHILDTLKHIVCGFYVPAHYQQNRAIFRIICEKFIVTKIRRKSEFVVLLL